MPVERKTSPEFFYTQLADVAADMWRAFERIKRDDITNTTDEAAQTENIVVAFLHTYLPRKVSVGRGYIMNASGSVSLQQDVVVFDPSSYVLLKNAAGSQVFPVECVYATIEVKATLSKRNLEEANKNVDSIRRLSGAALKVDLKTGDIVDVEQLGAVVFSSVFAFKADASLEACAKNFEDVAATLDFLCILNKGIVCCLENERAAGEGHVWVSTTTTRADAGNGYMFLAPKTEGASALPLAFLLGHIVSHVEEHAASRGRYSMYNYLRIPKSAYSIAYRNDKPQG